MNKFESTFFSKYILEGQKIKGVLHIHFIDIMLQLFLWILMGALLPSFLYYYSEAIRGLVPFIFLESLLIFVFVKIIYDIFDWYNDVWIITNVGVVQLERSLLKTDVNTVDFTKIEGLEVKQYGVYDKIFKKGDILIHKIGDDSFLLKNAISPYKAVDFVEEINTKSIMNNEMHNDKFDIIMDALGGVVENYLDEKNTISDKEQEINKIIKEVENNEGTIDLR